MNTTSPQSDSGTYYIDALLADGGTSSWSSSAGTSASVSYSFLTSLPQVYRGSDESNGFAAFNSAQESAARTVLSLWAEVANLTFTETTGSLGSIRFGTATLPSSTAGWAYYPGTGTGGDVWITNYYASYASPTVGDYAFTTFLHEVGHALGLKHPGDYNADDSGTDGPYLPTAEDSSQYTLMSYNDHPSVTAVDSITPMLYDIAAMQYLYGANTSTRSGDSTYSWNTGESVLEALWDGGGSDTIDTSNQTAAQTIDLRAGYFSSIAGETDNVAIAYNVMIENATGGSGNDHLIGNSSSNQLEGGSGDDTIDGAAGDTIIGGDGSDWVTLDAAGGDVTLSSVETLIGGSGADSVTLGDSGAALLLRDVETIQGGSGSDQITLAGRGVTATFTGVEAITGGSASDFVIIGGAGLTGTLTNVDIIRGGDGSELVTLGGSGQEALVVSLDVLIGSSGGDFITLGNRGSTTLLRGIETLRGGAGADVITIGNIGGTILLVNIETLIGGSGADMITLGGLGSTTAVRDIETIVGGNSVENLTVTGSITFQGGGGGDVVALQSDGGSDRVVFADSGDGGATGANSGFDIVSNFQTGTDKLVITGNLASAVDDNGNGTLGVATRASGTVDASTDEMVVLNQQVGSLTDTDLASFRSALGGLTNSSVGQEVLVLANNGTNTGVYLVTDDDGNGTVAASEVRLLAGFAGVLLGASDVAFG